MWRIVLKGICQKLFLLLKQVYVMLFIVSVLSSLRCFIISTAACCFKKLAYPNAGSCCCNTAVRSVALLLKKAGIDKFQQKIFIYLSIVKIFFLFFSKGIILRGLFFQALKSRQRRYFFLIVQ